MRTSAKKVETISCEQKQRLRASSRCTMATIALPNSLSWNCRLRIESQPNGKQQQLLGKSHAPRERWRRKPAKWGDSRKENEMIKTRKKVNEKIGQIVAESSNEDAGQLFKALSKVGGRNFRRAMRRVHRIIKKQAKRRK